VIRVAPPASDRRPPTSAAGGPGPGSRFYKSAREPARLRVRPGRRVNLAFMRRDSDIMIVMPVMSEALGRSVAGPGGTGPAGAVSDWHWAGRLGRRVGHRVLMTHENLKAD
jgi:hypothetical protein